MFLLEGVRLCADALQSQLEITACITAKHFADFVIPEQITHFEATAAQLKQISDSRHPQGIICIAKIPQVNELPVPEPGKTLLVLDRLADPGNMGTIFRSALWFGVTDILLGPGCVDPYNPKVVRSSMGAIARLQLHASENLLKSAEAWQQAEGKVAALHMKGQSLALYQPDSGLFLLVGSEAHGLAPELLDIAVPISIERTGYGESLNAAMAAGIALYELNRS